MRHRANASIKIPTLRLVVNKAGGLTPTRESCEIVHQQKPTEDQLRQVQKMEVVGQLAAGLAHDFNNTLMTILMGLGMLRESPFLDNDSKESLNEIERATARAINLTRQLLLFSRQKAARIEQLDLKELIANLLNMLRRLLGENIDIAFECASECIWVSADASMIEQIVMNLCLNARDAMPRGGRLTLAAVKVEVERPPENPDARPGRFVRLSVNDTGCGMDETILRRAFEPFFTTKEAGKGTGLGLATVYGIVKQHQGWIEVESVVGRGSSFLIYLPQTTPVEAPADSPQDEKTKGGSEIILLVEDDHAVRHFVAARLRTLGYIVLEAGNGVEALEIWEQYHQQIDLLFTDMMMPGKMTGMDLALQLKIEQPALKVISSSGYTTQLALFPFTSGPQIVYLPKPYEPAALAVTVRRCLDNS